MADYTVTGDTRLDTSGFTKGISSMTVAAGNLISGLVSTATSKMAGLAKSSVSVGMSFEASMSQVAATMGKSTDEIESLTRVAKEMGSSTKFSATQAADALNYLALAGYDADKAAEVLPSVLNLAAAGGMDLAYASDLVTDAMASLNIEANKNNVDDFGNKLAMAASKAGRGHPDGRRHCCQPQERHHRADHSTRPAGKRRPQGRGGRHPPAQHHPVAAIPHR